MEKRLTADLNVVANSNLEIQLLDGDLNIIQKLDDEPNDVGGLSSAELKAKFDESGNIIKKYINEILIPAVLTDDATEESRKQAEAARQNAEIARNFWEDYDSTKSYAVGNKVAYGGSSYLCIKPCTGIAPPNAEYWRLIASRGADGAGSMHFRGTTLVIKSGTLPPSGDYETYSGDYSVKVPFGGDDAVLETGNKLMRDNLTVEAVNVAETTNPAGGKTMIIGE